MQPKSKEEIAEILERVKENLKEAFKPENQIARLLGDIERYKRYREQDPIRGWQWSYDIRESETKIRELKREIENERN